MPRESTAQPPAGLRAATPACSSGSSARLSLVPKLDKTGAPPRNLPEPCQDGRIRFVRHKLRTRALLRLTRPALIEGRERVARGSVHNVTDPEFPSHRIG